MSSLSNKIAWNTVIQLLGKGANTTLGVLITVILTRYLGPGGFGTFTFILVFATIFGTFADWGLSLITVREASQNEPLAPDIIGNVLVVRLILSVLAAGVAILVSQIFPQILPAYPQIKLLIVVATTMVIASSLKTSFQIVFNVKLKMENWAISELSTNVIILAATLLLVYLKIGLAGVIVAYVAGDIAAAAVAAFLGLRLLPIKITLFRPDTKYLLWEALPMGTILVLFTIYNRIDTVILSFYKGSVAVGYYGAAYRVYEVLTLGAAYFANSILPIISNLANTDRARLGQIYRKSFVILFGLGLFVSLTNFLLAPLGISIIAGPKFTGSVWALQILSLALVASYFNHLNGYTIVALGKQWYSLGIAIIALIVNVTLNIFFIPLYSYPAAALITFVTEALIVILSMAVIKKELHTLPHPLDIVNVTKELITKRGQIF